MESEWSLLMLMGPERARFTQARVMGSRLEAATYIISYIKARPAEEVAVTARAPAASAPMQADRELCSDSTGTNSVFTSPLATYWAKYWGISVEGVMGKAAITSGSICFMAKAMASLPERRSL